MAAWGADARYTRLVVRHEKTLLRLALLLTRNREDAEDVVQDALLSVAHSWSVTNPTHGLAYLKRSVANRAVDLSRRRRETASAEIPETAEDDLGFLRHESDQAFFALVTTLPPRQQHTLVLRYYADLDDREIAKILGVSPGTVRSQATHALAKLRNTMPLISERYAR